ncbi:hypothetical protein FRC08_016517 [Ceratobasidium sp. 394]|nr:hypothetical protein FRC08_016517 [Ceratobasidium sp. 394]
MNRALRIVNTCGDLNVLNKDVRLGNRIVEPDECSVVMPDFSQARLRREDENDFEWDEVKALQDEERRIGYAAARGFGWTYIPSEKLALQLHSSSIV